jgi:hypothetical protein
MPGKFFRLAASVEREKRYNKNVITLEDMTVSHCASDFRNRNGVTE